MPSKKLWRPRDVFITSRYETLFGQDNIRLPGTRNRTIACEFKKTVSDMRALELIKEFLVRTFEEFRPMDDLVVLIASRRGHTLSDMPLKADRFYVNHSRCCLGPPKNGTRA